MASAFIWTGVRYIPTFRLRIDTEHKDRDIQKNPGILTERQLYEDRKHLETSEQIKLIA